MYSRTSLLSGLFLLLTIVACSTKPDPAKIAQGKWNITSMTLADNTLDASMLDGSFFEFGANGEFTDNIMGDRGKGTFSIKAEGTGFVVDYQGQELEQEEYTFTEITDSKMVLAGQSHGMDRTLVLEKAN